MRMTTIISKINFSNTLLVVLLMGCVCANAQVDKEQQKIEKEANNLLRSASSDLNSNEFTEAEVDLRKAISLVPADETGKYNLGNAYYEKELNDEAMRRFVQAAEIAESKPERHKAYHNLGNTFMNAKKYQEAVEAYKNALRNDPTDEETRYNLALAKEMLEKNPPPEGGDDDKDEENNKDEENKDDQGKDQEGDEGDEKENEDKGEEKDENKDGDEKDDRGNPKDPNEQKDGEGEQPKQQKPTPGQLSPQQVKNLLEAMNNEEKKVQDKINARKQKGAKVKSDKDW